MIRDYNSFNSLQYSLSKEPFCDMQEFTSFRDLGGREGGANSSCTYDHLAIAACDLVDTSLFRNVSIPVQYQVSMVINTHTYSHTKCTYFVILLQYFSDPDLGGLQETIDFCPIHSVSCPASTSVLNLFEITIPVIALQYGCGECMETMCQCGH